MQVLFHVSLFHEIYERKIANFIDCHIYEIKVTKTFVLSSKYYLCRFNENHVLRMEMFVSKLIGLVESPLNRLLYPIRLLYLFGYKLDFSPQELLQGPVVQSIVSLTSSLRGQLIKCFTTL